MQVKIGARVGNGLVFVIKLQWYSKTIRGNFNLKMPNIYYLKRNLIWHVIQTEKYKLNTHSFVEMRRINKWMMGVNMSWATWGLETAVRPHVASLFLNAKNLWVSGGSNIVVALRINLVIFYLFSRTRVCSIL